VDGRRSKPWVERARALLEESLKPPRQEPNELDLIKPADPENKSRKYAEYAPAWA
jgi:hypothetical protein